MNNRSNIEKRRRRWFGRKSLDVPNLNVTSSLLPGEEDLTKPSLNPSPKQYQLPNDCHLGAYQTVRGPINETMGLANLLSNDKNKTDDLDVPLTHKARTKKRSNFCENVSRIFKTVIRDWIFLALLGFIMASLSFGMDYAILNLQNAQMMLYNLVIDVHILLAYLVWVGYVAGLTVASALVAHYIAPQAIGSGIPEMKTILRGVILKEYLSIRTLFSKMIGLTLSLGSGLPMGKEGPFVHVASAVASQLSRFVLGSTAAIFENETRSAEMLAAGCAVGVACTFSAPIGGVLFSIEVTSVYFAVRNYWRGFFAATCSATLFRILRMFSISDSVTVEAHYQTNFPPQNVFLLQELPIFALIGLVCGFAGSAFVYIHRRTVLFLRRSSIAKKMFQKYWVIYPLVVATFISSLSFPQGLGLFMGGEERFSHTMTEFFMNCTWTAPDGIGASCVTENGTSKWGEKFDIHHWEGPNMSYSPFITLAAFQLVYFFLTLLASTLPVPSGIFMPVFVLGAAFGRMVGEGVYQLFPNGISADAGFQVWPGIYAVVGAAAFCGAVTHTVSVAVIVFELTGQLCTLLPVMIAVLIANAIASYLQPSIYDSIIRIKNLPYLPDIPHTTSLYHEMRLEHFMITPVVFISKDYSLAEIRSAIESRPKLRAFPLVDSIDSLALVGSVSRSQLQRLIDSRIGTKARYAEATRRIKQKLADEEAEREMEAQRNASQRKNSRFLVVPVQTLGNGSGESSTKALNQTTLDPEAMRKILTDQQKQELFDDKRRAIESHHTIGDIFRSITNLSFGRQHGPKKPAKNEFDIYGQEKSEWEKSVLEEKIDLNLLHIDSTPFQLSEATTLFKAHSLFSLLGLNRSYVTRKGQLIGVVALKELRIAIEYLQAGKTPLPGINIFHQLPDLSSTRIAPPPSTTPHQLVSTISQDGCDAQKNMGFIPDDHLDDDNGEDDAHDDYLQPPLEIVRRGAVTPDPIVELNFGRINNDTLVSMPSTSSSCVSIDLAELPKETTANLRADNSSMLTVPQMAPRSKSASDVHDYRSNPVIINLPEDDDVHDEKL